MCYTIPLSLFMSPLGPEELIATGTLNVVITFSLFYEMMYFFFFPTANKLKRTGLCRKICQRYIWHDQLLMLLQCLEDTQQGWL